MVALAFFAERGEDSDERAAISSLKKLTRHPVFDYSIRYPEDIIM